jgi:hypothetical protein
MLAKHQPPRPEEGVAEAMRLTPARTHSPPCAVKSNPSGQFPLAIGRRAFAVWPREFTNDGSVPKRHRRRTKIRRPIVPELELPSWLHQRRNSPKEIQSVLGDFEGYADGGISAN